MKAYKIAAILWEDHTAYTRTEMVKNPDKAITPVLTVGIIYKETPKCYVVVSDVERYGTHTDASYTVILKPVVSIKEYGDIKLRKL